MRTTLSLCAAAVVLLAGRLNSQSPPKRDILAAIALPKAAEDVRREGVSATDVGKLIDILLGKHVPPDDARQILITERDVARNHGPVGNFGAVVQSKLDQGLRGRELADAIRAEHGLAPRGDKPKAGEKGKTDKGKAGATKPGQKKKVAPNPQQPSNPMGQLKEPT